MALTTEEAAYNTALVALVTAWKAVVDAGTAGDVIQLTPVDVGQDATYNKDIAATAVGNLVTAGTGPVPSFTTVHSLSLVDDGEFPIAIAGPNGKTPIFYAITNQAKDLS